jgi:hypothetical protein
MPWPTRTEGLSPAAAIAGGNTQQKETGDFEKMPQLLHTLIPAADYGAGLRKFSHSIAPTSRAPQGIPEGKGGAWCRVAMSASGSLNKAVSS